ncbi:MAG: Transcriptional regulator/antitoxin, MazE, partial [Microgenomates group bacterium GW2011_GWC1_40_35]
PFFDKNEICKYNVITMITTLVPIGNSRGIRIPKPLLNESGISDQVELKVKRGEIRIIAVPKKSRLVTATLLLSEKTLATDWNKAEEDEAWASLQ